MSAHLSYVEAVVVGAFQGVTELFPVSSLGHAVLVPALVGGQWARDLNVSTPESPYLAFIVGLHVATAAALLVFFWRDWLRIVAGFVSSARHRRIQTPDERLAWLIVVATIPVGLAGVALEHLFRTTLGKPIPAAAFLLLNGIALYAGEVLRRRVSPAGSADQPDLPHTGGLARQSSPGRRRRRSARRSGRSRSQPDERSRGGGPADLRDVVRLCGWACRGYSGGRWRRPTRSSRR